MDEPLREKNAPTEQQASAETTQRPEAPNQAQEESGQAATERAIGLPLEAKSLLPSAALIGVGLLLESEFLVGVALGTGIMIASKWVPQTVSDKVQPIVNGTVQACYSAAAKTSEMLGEAAQRVEGIITRQPSRKEPTPPSNESQHEAQERPDT